MSPAGIRSCPLDAIKNNICLIPARTPRRPQNWPETVALEPPKISSNGPLKSLVFEVGVGDSGWPPRSPGPLVQRHAGSPQALPSSKASPFLGPGIRPMPARTGSDRLAHFKSPPLWWLERRKGNNNAKTHFVNSQYTALAWGKTLANWTSDTQRFYKIE